MSDALVGLCTGGLRGHSDGLVQTFLGVPFAAPPVGPLRFRPPQRPVPRTGTRDARLTDSELTDVRGLRKATAE